MTETNFAKVRHYIDTATRLNPSDVGTLIDLAAYGLVEATITDGPIEMARAFGIATDVHLFQIMAFFGGYARATLRGHLQAVVSTVDDLESVDTNIVLAAAQAIMSACANGRSELPGTTLGALLGDAIPAQRDHVSLSFGYLMADAVANGGMGSALLRRAVRIITKFPQWPGSPWWPAIVAECRTTVRQHGTPEEAARLGAQSHDLAQVPALVAPDVLNWFIHSHWHLKAISTVFHTHVMRPPAGRR